MLEPTGQRERPDIIASLTLNLGGVQYATMPLRVPYRPGQPLHLFVVPAGGPHEPGTVDCLITDDPSLVDDHL